MTKHGVISFCSQESCNKVYYARGLCRYHYEKALDCGLLNEFKRINNEQKNRNAKV